MTSKNIPTGCDVLNWPAGSIHWTSYGFKRAVQSIQLKNQGRWIIIHFHFHVSQTSRLWKSHLFEIYSQLCKRHASTFKDHESATEAECKHIASRQCEHLWSTIKSTCCVHLCVSSSRRKTRGPVAERDHARASARRLHELNNPRLGKNCRGKWNFPTRGGKKRRRANPPACLGPTMSGRKNGYKKIKGCRVGGC